VIVRASAGTGKTHRLAVRCIELLARGERVDGILATTFTRKAAGEIRERVLSMLGAAATDAPGAVGLLRERIPGFDRERARSLLADAVARSHRVQIMTIDALAARMASMVQLEIGLPPGWSVIDDLGDAALRTRALDRVLDRVGVAGMMPILHDLHDGAMKASIHGTILDLVRAGESAWRSARGDAGVWERVPEPPGALGDAALAGALETLARTPMTVQKKAGGADGNWAKAHAKSVALAMDHEWVAFLDGGLGGAAEEGVYRKQEFPEGMREAYLPVVRHAVAMVVRKHAMRSRALASLLERFVPEYEALKREAGVVRFEDVPRALDRGVEAGALGAMYYRLDTRFRHVLLDEFQDTSAEQFALVEPMVSEIVSGEDDARSVLIVGDPKQTLYSWRNAAPGLMDEVERRWPAAFTRDELHLSRRSSPAVLEAVNRVFGGPDALSLLAGAPAAEAMARDFLPHASAKEWLPGVARLREVGEPVPRTDDERDAAPPAWAMVAADLVQEISAAHPEWTVGVLTRKGKSAGAIIGVLRGRGVFASAERGTALGATPAVAAFAALLTMIDHPGHTMAAYLVSMTPVGRPMGILSHANAAQIRAATDKLRRRIADEGVAALATEVAAAIAPCVDARSARRFDQLIELCEGFDRDPSLRLTELADRIWTVPVEDPSASRVRVMTVHASKGLEFDAVILPELGDPWSVRGGDVLMDQPDPLAPPRAVSVYAGEVARRVSPELAALHAATTNRRYVDELCALYVAMTRARSRVEMVVPPRTKSELDGKEVRAITAARVLRAALAPESDAPGVLWEHTHAGDPARAAAERAARAMPVPARPSPPTPRFVARRGDRPTWRLERTTPSSSGAPSGGAGSIRSTPMGTGADTTIGSRFGDLVHAWFAGLRWTEDGVPDDAALAANAAAIGLDDAVVARAIARFRRAATSAELAPVLSREAAAARFPGLEVEARVELPFLVRDPAHHDARVLAGRFDRVVLARRGTVIEHVEIVDYKTDAPPTDAGAVGAWMAARAASHDAQMQAYRRAAAALVRVPIARVSVSVAFVGVPALIGVQPTDQ
jgi:ATP-dependent exoDNAse (exonuclease V) beta subunit